MSGICERLGVQVPGPTRPGGAIPPAYSPTFLDAITEKAGQLCSGSRLLQPGQVSLPSPLASGSIISASTTG